MSYHKEMDTHEMLFRSFILCIRDGETRGIKWKDSAKALLWADDQLAEKDRIIEKLMKDKS